MIKKTWELANTCTSTQNEERKGVEMQTVDASHNEERVFVRRGGRKEGDERKVTNCQIQVRYPPKNYSLAEAGRGV